MKARIISTIVFSLLVTSLVSVTPSAAGAVSAWCSDGASVPCITSASRNGGAITSADATWGVTSSLFTLGGSNDILWGVTSKVGNPYVLGPGSLSDTWVITIDTGTTIPRVSFTHGTGVTVVRTNDGDNTWHVTITANPVVVVGDCDQSSWPWICPETATTEWNGYLDGQVTDYGVWDDAAQRDAMFGMDMATNVAATSMPPEIVNDPASGMQQLLIRMANPHFRIDGTTVFSGDMHVRIPFAFLQNAYGVDDPTSLTSSGLAPTVSGPVAGSGAVAVTVDTFASAVGVDATGLNFSARSLKIGRGTITPGKPADVSAERATNTRARVMFLDAPARGSQVTGYQARCTHGSDVATASAKTSPIMVPGLTPGSAYACRVRAKSDAGAGTWSAPERVPGRP